MLITSLVLRRAGLARCSSRTRGAAARYNWLPAHQHPTIAAAGLWTRETVQSPPAASSAFGRCSELWDGNSLVSHHAGRGLAGSCGSQHQPGPLSAVGITNSTLHHCPELWYHPMRSGENLVTVYKVGANICNPIGWLPNCDITPRNPIGWLPNCDITLRNPIGWLPIGDITPHNPIGWLPNCDVTPCDPIGWLPNCDVNPRNPIGWLVPSSEDVAKEMNCSSVLKKRHRKMKRHKYRKLRRKMKFLRRRLGK